MVFYYFFQKSLFTENYFLIAAINLATQGPLYTCLALLEDSAIQDLKTHTALFPKNNNPVL